MKKLVRDKIPEIIEEKGKKPKFYISDKTEYKKELFKKLLEEAEEVLEEQDNKEKLIEELGDLMEVYLSILKLENIEFEKIEKVRKKKLKNRGGFEKKIILEINF